MDIIHWSWIENFSSAVDIELPSKDIGNWHQCVVKTINILKIYQVLMSATISKCELCGQEFGTPGELDEHKRTKHQ